MNIYKLNYLNKKTAIADLLAKGLYIEIEESLVYGQGVHAIVELGKIVLENGTYDEDGNELTTPVYAEGYHYDIMCEQDVDFGENSIIVNNPKHGFLGYE
jgi:hypothetical protein